MSRHKGPSKAPSIREMRAKGMSVKEIAAHFGVTESYVRSVEFRTLNPGYHAEKTRGYRERQRELRHFNPLPGNQRERALRLAAAGMSPFEIAQVLPEAFGCRR